MLQNKLIQAISRATGEDCDLINRRGFSLVSDEAPLSDDDFDALIDDWHRIAAEEVTTPFQELRPRAQTKQPTEYRNLGRTVRAIVGRSRSRFNAFK